MSTREAALIDRARKKVHPPMTRADFMREAALKVAVELADERGFELVRPEESRDDPDLWELFLRHRGELARRQALARRSGAK